MSDENEVTPTEAKVSAAFAVMRARMDDDALDAGGGVRERVAHAHKLIRERLAEVSAQATDQNRFDRDECKRAEEVLRWCAFKIGAALAGTVKA